MEQLVRDDRSKVIRAIINENVKGKLVPRHTDTEHRYEFVETGTVVKSVTTKTGIIEKKWLIPWAIKKAYEKVIQIGGVPSLSDMLSAYEKVRDEAGEIGTIAHGVIDQYTNDWILTGKKPADITKYFVSTNYHGAAVAAARSAEKAYHDYDVIPLASEILVGVEEFNCAGTLDLLVLNKDGEIELWDWKTSNQVSDEYALQVAAYKRFFEGMTGLTIARCKILHLSKDHADYKVYELVEHTEDFNRFISAVELYDWVNSGRNKLEQIYE